MPSNPKALSCPPFPVIAGRHSQVGGIRDHAFWVAAVDRLMSPATNSKGEALYPYHYLPGTETQWAGWNYFGAPSPALPPRFANMDLPEQFLRYFVDPKERKGNVDALHFDFDHYPATLSRSRRIYDALSVDLRVFNAHGGKILMWHGWADGAMPATSSIGYYEGVIKAMSGRKQTEDFFRLFLVPGVQKLTAFVELESAIRHG
jgi:hypothetical protein